MSAALLPAERAIAIEAEAAYVAGLCSAAVLDRLSAREGLAMGADALGRICNGMYELLAPEIERALRPDEKRPGQ